MTGPKEAILVNYTHSYKIPWLARQLERCNYWSHGFVQSSSYMQIETSPMKEAQSAPLCFAK